MKADDAQHFRSSLGSPDKGKCVRKYPDNNQKHAADPEFPTNEEHHQPRKKFSVDDLRHSPGVFCRKVIIDGVLMVVFVFNWTSKWVNCYTN